jgi:hypothetical protein
MSRSATLPSPEARDEILGKMADLLKAIEAHPKWTPPSLDPGLFHVWDFVNRSRYIVEELDNIKEGKELKHPEQIPKNEGGESEPERRNAHHHYHTHTHSLSLSLLFGAGTFSESCWSTCPLKHSLLPFQFFLHFYWIFIGFLLDFLFGH